MSIELDSMPSSGQLPLLVAFAQVVTAFFAFVAAADNGASGSDYASNSTDIEFYSTMVIEELATMDATSNAIANINFVKTYMVTASGETDAPISILDFFSPGRIIVSYVDFEEADDHVNASTLAQINIYADSAALAEQIRVGDSVLGDSSVFISFPTRSEKEIVRTGYLLIEVTVFRRNQIHEIRAEPIKEVGDYTTLEVIINDGVLCSKDEAPNANGDGVTPADSVQLTIEYEAAVYVLAKALNVYRLGVYQKGGAILYLDTTSIAAASLVTLDTSAKGSIVTIAKTLDTETLLLDGTGETCIFVTDTLELDHEPIPQFASAVAFPGLNPGFDATGAFTCTKSVIPGRAARDISIEAISLTPSSEVLEVSPSAENGAADAIPTSLLVGVVVGAGLACTA